MLFLGIDRILLTVKDADEAGNFFGQLFGIDIEPTIVDSINNVKVIHTGRFGLEIGSPADSIKHTPLSDGDRAFLEEHGPGVRMVVVRVSDLDEAIAHFAKYGLEPIAMNPIPNGREAFFDSEKTFGMTICLNEYKDVHPMGIHGREFLQNE